MPSSTTIKLSSKGQVVIPKAIRKTLKWKPGLKLEVIYSGNGIILRPKKSFPNIINLKEVTGCLKYSGQAKTLRDMEDAMHKGAYKDTSGQ